MLLYSSRHHIIATSYSCHSRDVAPCLLHACLSSFVAVFCDGDEVCVERARIVHLPSGKSVPRAEPGAHFPALAWSSVRDAGIMATSALQGLVAATNDRTILQLSSELEQPGAVIDRAWMPPLLLTTPWCPRLLTTP